MSPSVDRKRLGAWYTPLDLVDSVIAAVITPDFVARRGGRPIVVLDPACGDGRFLAAAQRRIADEGGSSELHGVDVDASAVAASRDALPEASIVETDALRAWRSTERFDLIVGNPPFLSPLSAITTRNAGSRAGGSSRAGVSSRAGGSSGTAGPYADVAVEFLALAADAVVAEGGRVAFVLPQSLLSSRDAAPVRDRIDGRASLIWSWWSAHRVFDAQVHTCVLAFEFSSTSSAPIDWSSVVTSRSGVPSIPHLVATDGTLGDRATPNANFRDEYYGMVPAVGDHDTGPRLITSGLIDPGASRWGSRPITFAKRRWRRPRIDLERLDPKMRSWASRRLVPKVLVANQTRIVEAVCDPRGEWLPAVPVVGIYPAGAHWDDGGSRSNEELASQAWTIAAVLTSGFASAWVWHRQAGTGLSADTIRLSPAVLSELPWPGGDLSPAVAALRANDLNACARLVDRAYGIDTDDADELGVWWRTSRERIEARQPAPCEARHPGRS